MNKLLIILAAGGFVYYMLQPSSISYGPGVIATEDPVQTNHGHTATIQYDKYTITSLADFYIKAKVLSRENYYAGRESELSPIDLALGWGPMSDEAVLEKIEITQSGRWYRWNAKELPIPRRDIEIHSANMHMIPANDDVEATLKKIGNGRLVEITGKLVRVEKDDGWSWVSSLTRMDTGNHSCELVYVEEVLLL